MTKHIFVGGLVAAGFDDSGEYLLTVSHAGRGLYSVGTWERVARDSELTYPDDGHAVGIGPIQGKLVKVVENYEEILELSSPNGVFHLVYDSGTITVSDEHA
jgi:hypothetical protein